MSDPREQAATADDEPRVDVFASLMPGVSVDELRRRAVEEAGMDVAKADRLVRALRSAPRVALGKDVPKSRAQKSRQDLARIGLWVDLDPVLSLRPISAGRFDGAEVCPACNSPVKLGPERRCPVCEVYVDKVDPATAMRKRLMAEERARLEAQLAASSSDHEAAWEDPTTMEKRLRQEIRAELESAYGLNRRQGLWAIFGQPAWAAGALLTVAGLSFAAGWGGVQSWREPAAVTAQAQHRVPPKDLDSLLARLDEFAPAAGSGSGSSDSNDPQSLFGPALAQQRAQGAAPGLEQVLASLENPVPAADAMALATLDKAQLTAQLALGLAQLGQTRRAGEVFQALQSLPASPADLALQRLVRRTDLVLKAWSLQDPSEGPVAQRLAALRQGLEGVQDLAERSELLAAVGATLARHGAFPDAVAQGFLTRSAQLARSLTDPTQQQLALQTWALSLGDALLDQLERHARLGRQARAQGLADQLPALRAQLPEGVPAVHLQGLLHRAHLALGQTGAARLVMLEALQQLSAITSAGDQAQALSALWQAAGTSADAAVSRATATVEAAALAQADPVQRARALAQLSLLAAHRGLGEGQAQWQSLALQTPGLPLAEQRSLRAHLLVEGDLAQAQRQWRNGALAEADEQLRELASYLI